jgi:amino acid transporter
MSHPALSPSPHPAEPPLIARQLGHAGLIPFVAGALLVWMLYPYPAQHGFVTLALTAYAGTIVAFLGGVHWGLAMRADAPGPRAFRWAMVPPLVAWLGWVMPAYAGLVLLGVMLLVCYSVDRLLYPAHQQAHWLTLRFRLSLVAALSCFIAAAGT